MNWFGFGAGPSDAKSSGSSPAKKSSSPNLRPSPNSAHASSSDSSQLGPSRPPLPALNVAVPPKDTHRNKEKKMKKARGKKEPSQQQQQPHVGWPGPMPTSPYGVQSPQTPQMPGAMPPSSPPRQSFYGGFMNVQQPQKLSPNSPGGFASSPAPAPGPPPAQPVGFAGALTNQIANVGYSLLDRLTNNSPSTRPK
jgi:hypothetical protein